jgi:hypothetical protein
MMILELDAADRALHWRPSPRDTVVDDGERKPEYVRLT